MGDIIQGEAARGLSFWQALGAKNQAFVEGALVLLFSGAGDVLVNQLNAGAFNGYEILRALEVGAGLGLAWVLAYLRGHVAGLSAPLPATVASGSQR